MGAVGCGVLYFGIALFMTSSIGLDPVTGLAQRLADKTGWQFKTGRRCIDFTMMAVGICTGGKFGVITILTAFPAGPMIQFFVSLILQISSLKTVAQRA